MGRGLSSEEIGRKKLHGPGQILEYAVAQVDIPVGPPVARVTSSGKDMLPSPHDQAPITVDPSPCDLKILRYFLRTLFLVIFMSSQS